MKNKKGGDNYDKYLSIYNLYLNLYKGISTSNVNFTDLPDELVLYLLLLLLVYHELPNFETILKTSYCYNIDDFTSLFRKTLNINQDVIIKADYFTIYLLLYNYIINTSYKSKITKLICKLHEELLLKGSYSKTYYISSQYLKKFILPIINEIKEYIESKRLLLPTISLNDFKLNLPIIPSSSSVFNDVKCLKSKIEYYQKNPTDSPKFIRAPKRTPTTSIRNPTTSVRTTSMPKRNPTTPIRTTTTSKRSPITSIRSPITPKRTTSMPKRNPTTFKRSHTTSIRSASIHKKPKITKSFNLQSKIPKSYRHKSL